MGVPVASFDDFRGKLLEVRDRSAIFGFLLYDSRPSQQLVNHFARTQGDWIDELARSAGIYFFFPLRRDGERFRNPSIELLRIFKLGVSRLPGIILFAPPGEDGRVSNRHAVYIPLQERDFNDVNVYEPIFIELFDLIREALEHHPQSDRALEHIRQQLARLRRRKGQRGFAAHLRKGAHLVLFELPRSIYGPFAEGFGRALGERAARV